MCGIAGIIVRSGQRVEVPRLESMTAALEHRGPDASGFLTDRNVGLGHRRLTVIDTSEAANQPLYDEDGSVAVVYNGEIYNFPSLTRELEARGHRFRTRSDTEVIVHAWEEFGAECVHRFRGMFAFAIYDAGRRLIFLARDRLGKKPLYYVSKPPGLFAFGSEIKALRCLPEVSGEIDRQALAEYATYGNTLGERSIYRDVRRLLPGHTLTLDLREEVPRPRAEGYWEPTIAPEEGRREEEWIEILDHEISEAVRLRLVSDVPLGAFLSGGVDSSLVVAYMAEHSDRPVETFTMAFGEASHDESSWAREVAERFGCEHHEELVTPDAVKVLDSLADVYDEPFADPSAIPTFYLARMTRAGVTVALSGDGGDEGFLGYPRYAYTLQGSRLATLLGPPGRSAVRTLAGWLPWSARLKRPLDRLGRRGFDQYHHALGNAVELRGILRPEVAGRLGGGDGGKLGDDDLRCPVRDLATRFSWSDLHNYLPDDVLVKVDRASMHHSLEVRSPLLDQKVVQLSRRIPVRHNLRGLTGKRLLRKLLMRWLPRRLTDRPKQGFGVPLRSWLRGPLAPLVEEMIADERAPMWELFDRMAVQARWNAHRRSRADLHRSLWRSLVYYRWAIRHR